MPTKGLPRDLRRLIDQLWFIGCTEAERRRSHAGKLDALTEATVWICDVLAIRAGWHKERYYLSHIDVLKGSCDGERRKLRSSLAEFDIDLDQLLKEQYLERKNDGTNDNSPVHRKHVDVPDTELSLTIPNFPQVLCVSDKLRKLWSDSIGDLPIAIDELEETDDIDKRRGRQPDFGDADQKDIDHIYGEFKDSLRYAYDAAVDSTASLPGEAFTLLTRWTKEEHPIDDCYPVRYVLGYLLPTYVRYHLRKTLREQLSGLEVLFESDEYVRTQTHTFVETRLSGCVFNYEKRARKTITVPDADTFKTVKDIETRLWEAFGGTPERSYRHLFMMPMVNYASSPPTVLGHWYFRMPELHEEDGERRILNMARTKQRASGIFFEMLYQRYCCAIAREIARGIARRDPSSSNNRLRILARVYGMATVVQVQTGASKEDSIQSDLDGGILTELGASGGVFDHNADVLKNVLELWKKDLNDICIQGLDKVERSGARFDILVELCRQLQSMAVERTTETHQRSMLQSFRSISVHVDDLRQKIADHKLYPHDAEDAWERLMHTSALYQGSACLHNSKDGGQISIGKSKWQYHRFHGLCSTCIREDKSKLKLRGEVDRRLAYLFQMEEEARKHDEKNVKWEEIKHDNVAARERFVKFCENFGSAEEDYGEPAARTFTWLKRSAQTSSTEPQVSAVVTMLHMFGVAVDLAERVGPKNHLTEVPENWLMALYGIARLAKIEEKHKEKHEDPDVRVVSISRIAEQGDILQFSMDMPFKQRDFKKILENAKAGRPSSRAHEIKWAHAQVGLRLDENESWVSMKTEPERDSLQFIWRKVRVV